VCLFVDFLGLGKLLEARDGCIGGIVIRKGYRSRQVAIAKRTLETPSWVNDHWQSRFMDVTFRQLGGTLCQSPANAQTLEIKRTSYSAMEPRRQTFEITALIILFLSITVFTVVGFAHHWMPPVASRHGEGVDMVIRYLLVTTGAILVGGTAVFVVFLWKYGRGLPTASPQTDERSERRWSLIPVVGMAVIAEAGVLVIGLPVWEQVYGDVPEDAVRVEVVARQFEWIMRYPGPDGQFGRTAQGLVDGSANPVGIDMSDPAAADDIIVRGTLRLPVGRTAFLRLWSHDVLHSFSVPAFRVKQDLVPGTLGRTMFTPTTIGRYEIACAEVCGMGLYRLSGIVMVQTEEEFQNWLDQQSGVGQ